MAMFSKDLRGRLLRARVESETHCALSSSLLPWCPSPRFFFIVVSLLIDSFKKEGATIHLES